MDILSVMGVSPQEKPVGGGFNINFNTSPDDYYNPRHTASGHSYVGDSGQTMYQPLADNGTEYLGTGRMPTAADVWDIAGTTTAKNSQMTNVAKLMRDPAVMQYFMDMYSGPAKAYSPNTITLKNREGAPERSDDSKRGDQCVKGMSRLKQRLMGCPPTKGKSWTQ